MWANGLRSESDFASFSLSYGRGVGERPPLRIRSCFFLSYLSDLSPRVFPFSFLTVVITLFTVPCRRSRTFNLPTVNSSARFPLGPQASDLTIEPGLLDSSLPRCRYHVCPQNNPGPRDEGSYTANGFGGPGIILQ